MSDFGFWELALILFVALLVVGPDRLPALAATLGRWVGRARNIAAQFKADFMNETHADDLKSIMGETRDAFDAAQHSIGEAGAGVNRALRNTDPLVQSIEDQIESGRFTGDTADDTTDDRAPGATPPPAGGHRTGDTDTTGNTAPDARPAAARTAPRTGDINTTANTTPATEDENTAPQHGTDARRQDPPVRRD